MTSNSNQKSASSGRLTNTDVRTRTDRDRTRDSRGRSSSGSARSARPQTSRAGSDARNPAPPRTAGASGRRASGYDKRKRLAVTSSGYDSISRQIEQEAGLQPDATPAKHKAAQEKKQKKTKTTRKEMGGARAEQTAATGGARTSGRLSETQQLVERKRQQRQARQRRSSLRRTGLILGLIALIAALVLGGNYALHSSLLAITDIQVSGERLLTQSEVATLAAAPLGTPLPLLNTRKIESNLAADVWIRSARVTRKLPHTVAIAITERRPLVYVDDGAGSQTGWLVSRDGVWLGAYQAKTGAVSKTAHSAQSLLMPEDERGGALAVTDVETPGFAYGKAVKVASVKNAVAIMTGVSDELRGQIKTISASNVASTALYLKSGIEVDIGSADHIADKDTIILKILKEQAGKVILINVCSVDKPTWRGLNSGE